MDRPSAPELALKYVCVTSKTNAIVAALISSYFSDPGAYFIVLTFPDVESLHTGTLDFRGDDYIKMHCG